MKVLIFSGGTGSIALQSGFQYSYPGLLDVQVLTNAYDNGKSTGLVRQVFDGKILGPSDVRKNQTTQFKLKNSYSAKDKSDSTGCRIVDFLEHRFNCETKDAEQYCLSRIEKLNLDPQSMKTIRGAVLHFFNQPKSKQISYNDFSLSNIVYAGIAAQNKFSLATAGKIMAGILNLPTSSVILNDDESLFLRAETESGYHILDEGEIVEWNNENDRIKRIYFVDFANNIAEPHLSDEATYAIQTADIIIFSSGTQWASLIPTYVSYHEPDGFYSLIKAARAKKFLVINNQQDKDMLGCSVNYMLDILESYIPLDDIVKVFNCNADEVMNISNLGVWDKSMNYEFCISSPGSKTHNSSVSEKIMQIFYETFLRNNKFAFDYDDTLVGRNNEYRTESIFNMATAASLNSTGRQSYIFTGNYIKALDLGYANDIENNFYSHNLFNYTSMSPSDMGLWDFPFKIYADGGVNLYEVNQKADKMGKFVPSIKFIKCIDNNAVFTNKHVEQILDKIADVGLKQSKVQNRNNATLSLKPIDDEYRVPICKLLNMVTNDEFYIRPSGRTTIDISRHLNTKDLAFNHLKTTLKDEERVTYIGDESHHGGNDHILTTNDMIDYLHVNNPRETSVFLITLLNFIRSEYGDV
jgi:2-phospho-L-lactate transferase/gluconeogenesis factor (CofD/UPF0052 family)